MGKRTKKQQSEDEGSDEYASDAAESSPERPMKKAKETAAKVGEKTVQ